MSDQTSEPVLLDWEIAEERAMVAGGARLHVEGKAPEPMRVEFHVLPLGVVTPEYRGVQVRGFRGDVGPEVVTDFTLSINEQSLPKGTVGYVLIGKTMRAHFPPSAGG